MGETGDLVPQVAVLDGVDALAIIVVRPHPDDPDRMVLEAQAARGFSRRAAAYALRRTAAAWDPPVAEPPKATGRTRAGHIGIGDATDMLGALGAVIIRRDPDDPDEMSGDLVPFHPDLIASDLILILRSVADGVERDAAKRGTERPWVRTSGATDG